MGKYVTFNQSGYLRDLEKEFDNVLYTYNKRVYRQLLQNFSSIKIRTVDKSFVDEMKGSIRQASTRTKGYMMEQFGAGEVKTPNQSFRVLYYEFGTGTKADYPMDYSPADDTLRNPSRPKGKSPIYQRPYGEWWDLGGNYHKSRTKGKPKRLPDKGVGRMIEPSHWFQRAFFTGTIGFDTDVLECVKRVPITSYISIRGIYKRM